MYGPQASYDAANHRIILFYADQQYVGETFVYSWDLSQRERPRCASSRRDRRSRSAGGSGAADSIRGEVSSSSWAVPTAHGSCRAERRRLLASSRAGWNPASTCAPSRHPRNSSVRFSWRLPRAGRMGLFVSDVRGRRVRTLIPEELPRPGSISRRGTAPMIAGPRVPAGVYFGALRVEGRLETGVSSSSTAVEG
jgi:hypothetical protein